MRKVVFSGGTHGGKTTLVEHFKSLGYLAVPEPGLTFISELVEEMGLEKYKDWRSKNQQEFFNRLVRRQVQLEEEILVQTQDLSVVFFDRSFIDTIAMCHHVGVSVPREAYEYLKKQRYDLIFFCEMIPDFDERGNTGRVFTKEDSRKIAGLVEQEYKKQGYECIKLPPISFEDRLEIVSAELGF